jgi:ribosomal-protein-alanine N-acetyltransferase
LSTNRTHSEPPDWRVVPFREEHGPEVCAWRYEPPYDLYNWPAWADMLSRGEEFADPKLRAAQYIAVIDCAGALVGYGQLFPLTGERGETILRLGLGMKPELCGQRLGAAFVRLLAAEARRRSPGCEVDLEVPAWNERAIRTYRKAGFVITDTYMRGTPSGQAEFHCMVYKVP